MRMPCASGSRTDPTQTKQDLFSLGRLLSIQSFMGGNGDAWLKRMEVGWRRKSRQAQGEEEAEQSARFEFVDSITMGLGPFVIRRTKESVDWDGKRIMDVPLHISVPCYVCLTPNEMEALDGISQESQGK